jgi:hypothetical protein
LESEVRNKILTPRYEGEIVAIKLIRVDTYEDDKYDPEGGGW